MMLSRDCKLFAASWYYCCAVVALWCLGSPDHQKSVVYGFGNFVSSRKIFGSFVKQKGNSDSIEAQVYLISKF
jgi:hypothetical protein